ncbi:hypothetical protein [Algicola sagamiensis]|uniref:hypothetical protein n=1 Tax=Algicola sagamiensis TaxID=163869 RepID=UPI0003829339|nr:hypothetical protein [Algicola sagamiensis]
MNAMLKIIISKLFTEKFLVRVSLLILKHLAKKTTNQLDDQMVGELDKALVEK